MARLTSLEPFVAAESDEEREKKQDNGGDDSKRSKAEYINENEEECQSKRQRLVERQTTLEPRSKTDVSFSQDISCDKSVETGIVSPLKSEKASEFAASVQPEKPDVPLDWDMVRKELAELVEGEGARAALVFLQDPPTDDQKFVALPPCNDKDNRRKLHQWIRSRLNALVKADTVEDDEKNKIVRLWHNAFERDMPNFKNFSFRGGGERARDGVRKRDRADERHQASARPPDKKYLQFVLYKENMDTGSALHQLAMATDFRGGRNGRFARGGRGGRGRGQISKLRLGYSGMKDKRGVTSQFVTVTANSVRPQELVALCNRFNKGGNRGKPGSMVGENNESGGGHTDSAGASVMLVGNFRYAAEELCLGRLRGNRFDIALRNVRTCAEDKTAVKKSLESAACELKESGFINYFGVQRFGKYCDTHKTGMAVLNRDFSKAVDIIMEPKPDEKEWVIAARKEWQNRFQSVGDNTSSEAGTTEKQCASRIVKQFGRFMNSEVAVLSSLEHHPLDYKRAYLCISKTMRMMFIHSVQSFLWNQVASYRLSKMPKSVVEGDLVYKCDHGSEGVVETKKEVRFVTVEDIASSRYTLKDIVLPLIGTKTLDPDNESGRQFSILLEQHGLTRQMLATLPDGDFDCPGDYRKLIGHPTDVDFEVLEYSDPRQPLIQTDLMKVQNIPIKSDATSDGLLLAMNVGFTLPSSSYATIAIRELMKRPTSSVYQSTLKLE